MKFFIKETVDLSTFTEETLNGKLHFMCSDLDKFQDADFKYDISFFKFQLKIPN